jgi:acetylglutamate kinase
VTRVVKIGGRAQLAPGLAAAVASAAASTPLCVVHGGGDEVSELQRRLGREPTFVKGRRVTTPDDLDLLRMALSGVVNKRLVARLIDAGVAAVGVSGEDGALLEARPAADASLGAVGEPAGVRPDLLHALLRGGFVPVVSPLARGPHGAPLNVNGDDAAAAIAAALGARELLLVADVPAVLDGAGRPVAALDPDGVVAFLQSGAAVGGMVAKLEAARAALDAGVQRVRIGDLTALTDASRGTVVAATPQPV